MKKFTLVMFTLALLVITVGNVNAQNNITVTLAGNGTVGYSGDGGASLFAKISGPTDVCADAAGNVYIADNGNSRIRKISATTGVITTVASGIDPYYMCMDASANLYFSTTGAVKKINAFTGIITTVAGTGTAGYSGDGGLATSAMIRGQLGICLDTYGNLYIADGTNNRVREVNATTGIITTIAGTGTSGYTGDGSLALSAELGVPLFVCVNAAGDVYIADQGEGYTSGITSYVTSNNMVIRKITASTGIITKFAGLGSGLTGVLATDALLGSVTGMCLDAEGNVYFNEESCSCRKIDVTTDSVNYVGGNFGDDDFADNINSLSAWMDEPHGLFVDGANNVLVADWANTRIRKLIQLTPAPSFAYRTGQSITACSGFAASIDTQMVITNPVLGQTEVWTVIATPINGTLTGFPYTAASNGIGRITRPAGLSYTPYAAFTGNDSFQVMVSNGTLSDIITVYVAVNAPDPGAISGPSSVCATLSIPLTETVSGGAWSASNPDATISATGVVSGIAAGVDTLIYTITGACIVTTTAVVTVNPLPDAGTITGGSAVCQGSAITLGDLATGGTWSESTGAVTVAASGSTSAIVTGISAGGDVINYSVTNICGTAITAMTVNVNPLPDAGTLFGPSVVCAGSGTTIASTVSGGIWSASNPDANVNMLGFVTGVTAGVDSIIYTVTSAASCTAAVSELVTVVSPPDAGIISGPASVCAGSEIALNETVSGGNWSHTNPNAFVSGTGMVTGSLQGVDTILYSVSNGYCTASVLFEITIDPMPDAGTISGVDNIHVGSSTTLSNTVTDGVWSSSNTSIATVSGAGLAFGVSQGVDSIIYTAANACGTVTTYFTLTVVKSNGVNNVVNVGAEELTIMPNPARENFSVLISSSTDEQVIITITNITGEKVKEITGTTNKSIDASLDVPAGIYLLNAATANGNMSGKIVIE